MVMLNLNHGCSTSNLIVLSIFRVALGRMANNSHAHPQHDTQTFHHGGEKREKRRQAKLAGSVSCATGPAICNIGRRNVTDANLVRGSPVMPWRR